MTPEELVAARKAAMREDGGILRGAGGLSGADAVTAAETLVKNFTNFPHLFPEGSIVGDSEALPAIWENWDTFTGLFAQARIASEAALVAAQANDTAGFQAALAAAWSALRPVPPAIPRRLNSTLQSQTLRRLRAPLFFARRLFWAS